MKNIIIKQQKKKSEKIKRKLDTFQNIENLPFKAIEYIKILMNLFNCLINLEILFLI